MPVKSQPDTEINRNIIEWINQREFFWLNDLRTHLGVPNSDTKYPDNGRLTYSIDKLKKKNIIQCVDVKGSERQYYRTKIIIIDDLK